MFKRMVLVLLAVALIAGCTSNTNKRKAKVLKPTDVTKKTLEIYPDGKPKEVGYYCENQQVSKVLYDENGVKNTTGKVPDGIVFECYDEGALLAEWNYKDGVLDGVSRTYYRNRQLWEERHWKEDKENGRYRLYYDNGQLRVEGFCNDEKLDGVQKVYSEQGKLLETANYKDGVREGLRKVYYDNGRLKAEENYKGDKLLGMLRTYNEEGKLVSETDIKEEVPIYSSLRESIPVPKPAPVDKKAEVAKLEKKVEEIKTKIKKMRVNVGTDEERKEWAKTTTGRATNEIYETEGTQLTVYIYKGSWQAKDALKGKGSFIPSDGWLKIGGSPDIKIVILDADTSDVYKTIEYNP